MMKKPMISMIAALLLTGSVATSSLIASPVGVAPRYAKAIDEKVKIKPEELPDAIRTKLSGDDFKGWEISAAYVYQETQTYEVDLKKNSDTKTVKFDKDGKTVR